MTSDVLYQDRGQADGTYHFKILVPSVAAGAIIGKKGETIALLQKETGAKVKMSKATDFYPGTTERVCLISGSVQGILKINEFIMETIIEKSDPNAKIYVDFGQRRPAERKKQVKILVPNCTAGMIIGKSGNYIKQIIDESGAYVQISQKYKDHVLTERCITVIGEIHNNKTACLMILAKIVEDPQSGSCLNVSYADVTHPVANFNPTGSPFAIPGNIPNTIVNSSDTSYSSNDSLNSPISIINNNFHNPQAGVNYSGLVPFTGLGMNSLAIPPTSAAQLIETIKTKLRSENYSDQAISDISAAINVLVNYGMLGLNLGIINGAPTASSLGIGMPNSDITNYQMSPEGLPNQGLYSSVPGMEVTFNSTVTSNSMEVGSNVIGSTGSLRDGMSGLGFRPAFTMPSTTSPNDSLVVQAEEAVFESFHRTSSFASQSENSLHVSSSFEFETGLNSGPPTLRKRLTSSNQQLSDIMKVEIEVGENIVGAILGPEGKSLIDIQHFSGANIQISKKGVFAIGTRNRIVTITGLPNAVNIAQHLIERQIAEEEAKRAQQNTMRTLR